MIQLTAAAQHEVIRLSQRAELDSPHVHLGIAPGGCLEQMYVLEVRAVAPEDSPFVFSTSDQDQPLQTSALQISVSADHLDSLEQLTLDYSEDLMGGTFRFVNPKASQTCSCGQSFSMANKVDPNGSDDT